MAGEGRRVTLGEVTDLLTGFPFKSAQFSDSPENIRLLRGDNIAQGRTRWNGVRRWPANEAGEYQSYELRPGDVVLAMDRPWIEAGLKHATITRDDCPSLLVQRVARLRARSGMDQRYLSYVISSVDFTNYVLGVQTGTAVPHISGGQIKGYEFTLPPIQQQIKAAELLGALDDKIELNRRTNETLDAVARAIFKSWFVDFEPVRAKVEKRETMLAADVADLFPGQMDDESEVPEGWRYIPLSELTSELRRGISPKYIEQGGVCVLNQRCIRDQKVSFDTSRRHDSKQRGIDGRELKVGDVLVNSTGVGTLGRVGQVWALAETTVADSHVTVVRARDWISRIYLGQNLLSREAEIEALGEGSTGQTELSRTRLGDLQILVPPSPVLDAFDKFADPLLKRITENDAENRTLASLRDLLLPKLISGKVGIGDAERLVGELGA